MADFLVTVDSDSGPREPIPVTLVSQGAEVSLNGSGTPTVANTTGPAFVARLPSSLGNVNSTLVRNAPARVFRITGMNNAAAIRYLKLYNKASGSPTVGTDFPFWVETLEASAPFVIDLAALLFSTGLGYAITTGIADSDTGAIVAGDITTMNISYL